MTPTRCPAQRSTVSYLALGAREALGSSALRAQTPFTGLPLLTLSPPKAPPPDTVTLGVKTSTCEFAGTQMFSFYSSNFGEHILKEFKGRNIPPVRRGFSSSLDLVVKMWPPAPHRDNSDHVSWLQGPHRALQDLPWAAQQLGFFPSKSCSLPSLHRQDPTDTLTPSPHLTPGWGHSVHFHVSIPNPDPSPDPGHATALSKVGI